MLVDAFITIIVLGSIGLIGLGIVKLASNFIDLDKLAERMF